jgi:ribosomal protein L40E
MSTADVPTLALLIEGLLLLATMISIWVIAAQVAGIRRLLEELVSRQAASSDSTKQWICPKCQHRNQNSKTKCDSCGYELV